MSEKLTEWFEPSVKPTIPGWYERKYTVDFLQKHCDWWDGRNWYGCTGSTVHSDQISTMARRWRGLAEKPKASK